MASWLLAAREIDAGAIDRGQRDPDSGAVIRARDLTTAFLAQANELGRYSSLNALAESFVDSFKTELIADLRTQSPRNLVRLGWSRRLSGGTFRLRLWADRLAMCLK